MKKKKQMSPKILNLVYLPIVFVLIVLLGIAQVNLHKRIKLTKDYQELTRQALDDTSECLDRLNDVSTPF